VTHVPAPTAAAVIRVRAMMRGETAMTGLREAPRRLRIDPAAIPDDGVEE
jgi:hypothetical protein